MSPPVPLVVETWFGYEKRVYDYCKFNNKIMMPIDKLEKSCKHHEYMLSCFLSGKGIDKRCCKVHDLDLRASFDV